MKLMLMCAALLLAASGCTSTTPEVSNNAAGQPSNSNAANSNAAMTKPAATVSEADITGREKQIWEAIKGKDADGFAAMLAEDAIYVSDDGVYDKAGTVKGIKDLALTNVALSDWKFIALDKDAAVVIYSMVLTGTGGGHQLPANPLRASTAWVNRGGKWMAVYHQDTAAKQAPANPPATSTKTTPGAKTATSPAATETAADPVAKEKEVWDALKRKDFDHFASLLTDDAVEVEPDGVYDKAGSVKGVSQLDFSSASLSDFKVVKLDDDASLVTYMVKGSAPAFGPEGERHSTIWINRAGKWLAVFHQGTPAVKPQSK
jgi:hypothetical protein